MKNLIIKGDTKILALSHLMVPILSTYLYFMTILVYISRIYLGHNYPTDTIIGATVSYISVIIVSLA